MRKFMHLMVLILAVSQLINAQNKNASSLVTASPHQLFQFKIPGAKLLSLFTLLTALTKFGGQESFVGRCLGAARKLRLIMPFLLYKLGVIVTTLGFLTLLVLKSLAIGIALLVLNAGAWFGKLALLKSESGWSKSHGWPGKIVPPPVHIHLHKDRHGGLYPHPPAGISYGAHEGYAHGSDDETSWSDRISKGLNATRSLAERIELIELYTRLGFNVHSMLNRLEASGVDIAYRRRIPSPLDNPIR